MTETGPQKVENLIMALNGNLYEIFAADDGSQRIHFSFLFELEETIEMNQRETLTKYGISTTEKPVDEFIIKILENI